MASATSLVARFGILAVALAVCVLKVFYFFTLDLTETGAAAVYDSLMQIGYTVLASWTVLYCGVSTSTGWEAFAAKNTFLRLTMGAYVVAMAIGAAYGLFQDGLAQGHVTGTAAYYGIIQIVGEVAVLLYMGKDLWTLVTGTAEKVSTQASSALDRALR
jgi:hypothetical protein